VSTSTGLVLRILPAVVVLAYFLYVKLRMGRRPEHERELTKAMLASEKLRRHDPAAADRALDAAVLTHGAAEEQYRMSLRARLPQDRGAARELRRRLLVDLEGIVELRRGTSSATGPGIEQSRKDMNAEEAKVRAEITKLDPLI
jgi:hypothetical protein